MKPTSVDEYLAQQPKGAETTLRRVREIIRRAIPGAQEGISYGIPAFRLENRTVLYLAGWKEHYSLYPSSKALELAFKDELAPYGLSHKGTIRFSLSEPVPARLIKQVVKFRLKELAARQRAKTTTRASSRRVRRR